MVKRLMTLILSAFIGLSSVSYADYVCPVHKATAQADHSVQMRESRDHRHLAEAIGQLRDQTAEELVKDLGTFKYRLRLSREDLEALNRNCQTRYRGASNHEAGDKACNDVFREFIKKRREALDKATGDRMAREEEWLGRYGGYVAGSVSHLRSAETHDSVAAKLLPSPQQPHAPSTSGATSAAPAVPATAPTTVQVKHTGTVNVVQQPQASAALPAIPTAGSMQMVPMQHSSILSALNAKISTAFSKWAKQDREFKQNVVMGMGTIGLLAMGRGAKRVWCQRQYGNPYFIRNTSLYKRFFRSQPAPKLTPSGIPQK